MKIKCAKCGSVLYTNPFGSNKTLDCPYCRTRLYKFQDVKNFVLRYFLLEGVLVCIMAYVSLHIFKMKFLAGLFLFNLLCDYVFEVPQKHLMRTGHLRYGYIVFKQDKSKMNSE